MAGHEPQLNVLKNNVDKNCTFKFLSGFHLSLIHTHVLTHEQDKLHEFTMREGHLKKSSSDINAKHKRECDYF